ncbi:MAG: type 4a pilus biogenesis protein PilO [Planctomycetota bacterium]
MRFGVRELVLLVVLMALPLSSWWLVFRPNNEKIEQAELEIEHKREMLEKLQTVTSRSDSLEAATQEIEAGINAIEARLPTDREIDSVVRQVSALAVEAGLNQPGMVSQPPVRGTLYMEQPIEMTLSGDFKGFYEFLLALEQMPRITRMPGMQIERSKDVDGHLQAEFILNIYFESEDDQS